MSDKDVKHCHSLLIDLSKNLKLLESLRLKTAGLSISKASATLDSFPSNGMSSSAPLNALLGFFQLQVINASLDQSLIDYRDEAMRLMELLLNYVKSSKFFEKETLACNLEAIRNSFTDAPTSDNIDNFIHSLYESYSEGGFPLTTIYAEPLQEKSNQLH